MKKRNDTEESKPDIKHDTMEFAASADGEDKLDFDDPTYEEEEISPEEIESLDDEPDAEASALNAAETDRLTDEDVLPEEDWVKDTRDEDE